jgi:transcriptional regulator with XRE-family HTH domain
VIKQRRIERGLTQEQLAKKAGVTKNYVTMVERGSRKGISFLVRVALADALGIPVLEVITPSEAKILALVEKGVTSEGAEVYLWSLRKCIETGERPPGSKVGAQLVIRKAIAEHPDQRADLEAVRGRLNELFG